MSAPDPDTPSTASAAPTRNRTGRSDRAGADGAQDRPAAGTRVAVMQPYFFPYLGYFRLLATCDVFVLYDCVQFPRRGRVHRCEVPGPGDEREWLTLPLAHQSRDTLIRDLAFADGARALLDERLARLPWFATADGAGAAPVRRHLQAPLGSVVDHLEQGLRLVAGLLGLDCRIVRSSTFDIPPALRGQQRILALCQAVGATHYVNSPGGRSLYDAATFAAEGIALRFLPDYRGPYDSSLQALMHEPLEALQRDVRADRDVAPTGTPGP